MRLNLGGYSEGTSGNAAVSDINERARTEIFFEVLNIHHTAYTPHH